MLALKIGQNSINAYSDFLGAAETAQEVPSRLPEIIALIMDAKREELIQIFEAYHTGLLISEKSLSYAKTFFTVLWTGIVKEMELKISTRKDEYENLTSETIMSVMEATGIRDCMKTVLDNTMTIIKMIESAREKNLYHITERARDYIDECYTEPVTLNSLSEYLRISPYYLSHAFKNIVGVNLIEYLNGNRIEAAKGLLADTEESVKDIAASVGFSDANYFCRVFKKYTDITPSQYRGVSRNR